MKVTSVEQGHLSRRVLECLGGVETSKAASEDNYTVPGFHNASVTQDVRCSPRRFASMLAAALYNRFMGTATIVTVQEFLALPEVDGQRIELIGGEVVCMGRASKGHEWVKANLNELLIGDTSGWFQGAPEVAIEVVSSEKASLLEKKFELYLAHGSKSVWVVFPEQQVVRIFSASGESRLFDRTQTLEDPTVLPGFSASVSAIFEGI